MKTAKIEKSEYYKIPRYRAFKVSYICETDFKLSRVKIEDLYFNEEHKKEGQKKSKIISYDHEFSDTLETGIHYLNTHGFNIVSTASTQDYYLVMCDNWGDKFEVLK